MKRLVTIVMTLAFVVCCLSACGGSSASSDTDFSSGTHHAEMKVKDYGTIKLELDADTAPITVENFAKLVNEKFYDGLTFHRIIKDFVIQGGDPNGNGTGGSKENIEGEFESNGIDNNISHKKGVISMARSKDYNSGSSQFFIVLKDSTYLDGQYAAFGRVTEGMEYVEKICADVTEKGTEAVTADGAVQANHQPVIESIKMID